MADYSLSQKIKQLQDSGELEYPKYRTLSEEQNRSYFEAKELPDFQRREKLLNSLDDSTGNTAFGNFRNAIIQDAASLFSRNQAEMSFGNMMVTGDWSPLVEEGIVQATAIAGGALGATAGSTLLPVGGTVAGSIAGYEVGGRVGRAAVEGIKPRELGESDLIGAAKQEYEQKETDLRINYKKGKITEEQYKKAIEEAQSVRDAQIKSTQDVLASAAIETFSGTQKDTEVQALGRKWLQAAYTDMGRKAQFLPETDADSAGAALGHGLTSASEYLFMGMAGKKIGHAITEKNLKPLVESGAKKQEVVSRYAEQVGAETGNAIALGDMAIDIMGQGALSSIQKYIEDTGDVNLDFYEGDLKNVSMDIMNLRENLIIEKSLGFGKLIKDPRAISKYGEWLNGFAQEFTQGEITDYYEWLKGNQDAIDMLLNIPRNAVEGFVGGFWQGLAGNAVQSYYHTKNLEALTDVIMSQSTEENPISESDARIFAEQKLNELESGIALDISKDVVQFTDASNYQGKIYDTIRDNIKKTIDYQREQMKETLEGSKYDDMSEDELAQHVESVAQDMTDRIVIEALDKKIPLSEVPQLKGETIEGTYYIEGSDYAKETAEKAQKDRETIRKVVYAKKTADKEAKELAFQETKPEEDKDLIVQHGTTLPKLKEALDLGGMPLPSLAVMKADQSSQQYGEITFVGGQDLISGEPVYTSDIYSARRVKPDLLINDAGEKYIRSLVGSHASFVIGNLDPNYGTYENALMHLYLLEKGVRNDPENIMRREGADFTQEFSKMSDSEQKEFTDWMKDFENKYFSKKIWAGYTPSGRQKYMDYTLENIVKLMAKKPKQGSEEGFGSSPHALKGIWAKPLKSIEEIRKNKDRLVSKEEYEQVDKEFWESVNKLTELLRTDYLVQNLPYSYDEHIISTLAEIKKNTDIKALLQENNMNDSDEAVQAVKDFKAFAESVPTKYFEAKPKRAVDFSEFNAVLLPSGAEYDAAAQKLAELGVKQILRFADNAERQAQIQTLKSIMFQDRQRGKGGAYDARTRSVTLGGGANVTTLPHELAHYWIDKNFKWARSGKASTAWMQQWQAVEKWLGIDPEDKYLTSEASEKFARAYERFLGEEELPLVLKKSMADFRDFVLDHYDYELDDAKGLQDRLGRPIKLNEDVKNWFRKSVYDSYMSPADMEVVNERLAQTDREVKEVQPAIDQSKELETAAQNSVEINEVAPTGMDIQKSAGVSNDVILGKKTIGGGEEKESKGAIASALGKTYESTSWDIQDKMIGEYLETVSIDEALDALEDGTYPDKIDPNFLRQALVEKLLDEGREIEAAALIEETADDFTEAAQKLQAARRVNTPFTNAIRMLTIGKATKLAEARYGKNKDAVKSLDAAMNALIAKYEKDFMNAQTDEERELVYAAMQDEAIRTIGTLEKDKTGGLDFQDIEDKEEKKQAKELRKRQIRRASINAYRSRAKRALKQALGLEPSREQVRQIKKLSVKVAREIKDFRKAVKENKTSAIDPTKILEAQNELNEYMNQQLPPRVLSTAMDAVNSYMMANMLWNPATNVFNLESTWVQMIPHMMAAYINYGKGTISWGEKVKLIKQALALQAKTGYNIFSLQDFFDKKTIWAEKFYEPTSAAGKAIRFPLTVLGLADTMNKGVVFLQHADSMATKQAKEEGKKNGWNKEQITQRAKELFYQALNTDPRTITRDGLKIRESAVREGEEATFTQNSQTAQFVNKFRKMLNFGAKTGLGNVIMPFTTTVANIAEDTVLNYGLGSVRNLPKIIPALATQFDKTATAEMKKEAWKNVKPETKNVIKNMIGIMMILSLALSDPDDDSYVLGYDRQTEVDKDIRQNRNAPSGYAVKIGNKWIDLDLFGIGSPWAKAYLIAKRHNNSADGWVKGVASVIDLVPGVGEIEDIYKSFETTVERKGETEALSEFAGGKAEDIIERLIPAQALFNQIGNITDTTKRAGYGSIEARVKGKLPFARETLEERTSKQTGEPIKQMDTVANLLTGQRIKEYVEPTPADKARYELAKEGKPLNYYEGRSKLRELGKESKEYQKAVQRVRRDFTRKLNSAAQTSAYQNLDTEEKKKFADKLHKEALDAVKADYGLKDKKTVEKSKKKK